MHTVFRFLRQLLLTVLLLALLTLVAAGGYFAVTGHKLYESAIQVTPIDTLYSSISSREGFVPYAQLPQTYINAVISAEDSRFTHHKGVDPVSIARALVTDLRTGSFAEGGSTITQQLAKNTLFTQEKHLARKAAEMFAALAIEKQYNKEQIFEMYVNTIYFGSGHYGIGEAAQGYFGKTPPTASSWATLSVVLTVASLGTRVALAYLLSATPLGVTGIWLSVPIGWALADAIGIGYYLKKHRAKYAVQA